jgi:tetratricopeptide (TPR) repeat protein
MRFWIFFSVTFLCLSCWALSQQDAGQSQPSPQSDQQKSQARSAEAGESSSRDTRIDLSPPKDDAKNHPNTGAAMSDSPLSASPEDMTNMTGDVREMHPWNPYRAAKDAEVGDYYLKQGNYKAALARYQDALIYKENDAAANFRMAQCYEKLHQPEEAIAHYKEYLKILPEGPFSKQAKKALEKLGAGNQQTSADTRPK